MSRVFLLQPPRKALDMRSAAKFGQVEYLFKDDDPYLTSVFDSSNFVQQIMAKLEAVRFKCSSDILCVAGSMVNVTLAVVALTLHGVDDDQVRLLLFNSTKAEYQLCRIRIDQLIGDEYAPPSQ